MGVRRSARKAGDGRAPSGKRHRIHGSRDPGWDSKVEFQCTNRGDLERRDGRVTRGYAPCLEREKGAVTAVRVLDVGVVVVVVCFVSDGKARGEHHPDERQGPYKSLPNTKHAVIVAGRPPGVNWNYLKKSRRWRSRAY